MRVAFGCADPLENYLKVRKTPVNDVYEVSDVIMWFKFCNWCHISFHLLLTQTYINWRVLRSRSPKSAGWFPPRWYMFWGFAKFVLLKHAHMSLSSFHCCVILRRTWWTCVSKNLKMESKPYGRMCNSTWLMDGPNLLPSPLRHLF